MSGHTPNETTDGILGDLFRVVDQGMADLLWVQPGGVGWTETKCIIGCRSDEEGGQSMVSIFSCSRNRLLSRREADCCHAPGGTHNPLH